MKMEKLSLQDLKRDSVEEVKAKKKHPLTLVLDNIRSRYNVGAVFRIADAFLIEKIILCGITPTPPHREIEKTALGATQSVSWDYQKDIFSFLKKHPPTEEHILIAVEQVTQSVLLHKITVDSNKKYILVFGNEVFGVQADILKYCHYAIEIPQWGSKHSLNISVSVGVVLWEFMKKMNYS